MNHAVLEGQGVPCWLLKIERSWWKNAEEGRRDGRPSGRAFLEWVGEGDRVLGRCRMKDRSRMRQKGTAYK